jgi:hypothetical protein
MPQTPDACRFPGSCSTFMYPSDDASTYVAPLHASSCIVRVDTAVSACVTEPVAGWRSFIAEIEQWCGCDAAGERGALTCVRPSTGFRSREFLCVAGDAGDYVGTYGIKIVSPFALRASCSRPTTDRLFMFSCLDVVSVVAQRTIPHFEVAAGRFPTFSIFGTIPHSLIFTRYFPTSKWGIVRLGGKPPGAFGLMMRGIDAGTMPHFARGWFPTWQVWTDNSPLRSGELSGSKVRSGELSGWKLRSGQCQRYLWHLLAGTHMVGSHPHV